jgi:hypothetical protein
MKKKTLLTVLVSQRRALEQLGQQHLLGKIRSPACGRRVVVVAHRDRVEQAAISQ